MNIEIENFHDRVRACLHTDSSTISDAVINYPEYSDYAEKTVKSIVTDWESLTGDDLTLFESCVIWQTAIFLWPLASGANIKVDQTTHAKQEYFQSDYKMILQSLKDRLYESFALLSEEYAVAEIFPIFTVSNPEKRRFVQLNGGGAL